MLVDARGSLPAARGVVQLEIFGAVLAVDHVGVLAGIKGAFGAAQESSEEMFDTGSGFQIRRVVPLCVAEREQAEILGLDGHDFLEVRLVPIAARRVLVRAAPNRIDQMELAREGLARHPLIPIAR